MADERIRNMEDFASVSGISRPTLSRFFHDPQSVRKTTRARIEQALEEFDYQPNIFAINQNRKLSKTIGILVPFLTDPFFAEIVRQIERSCIDAGYWPIVFSAHGETELENNALATLRSLKPAGALIAPLGRTSKLHTVERFTRDVPTVVIDSNVPVGKAFVGSDNQQSVTLIVDYLCRTGEPPCFFEMPPVNPNAGKRRDAYISAMQDLGHEPLVISATTESRWQFEQIGLETGLELISRRAMPSGTVLCSNDRIAMGLITAAYQKGMRVGRGEDCALRIAGHDDHPFARFTCPPLTTVRQDYDAIATKSVNVLFNLINGDEPSSGRLEHLHESMLVTRASA